MTLESECNNVMHHPTGEAAEGTVANMGFLFSGSKALGEIPASSCVMNDGNLEIKEVT